MTIPHVELERALLGAILVNNESLLPCARPAHTAHFAEPLHREIFTAAAAMIDAGKTATPVTLKSDAIPGRYLALCAADATTPDNARGLAVRIITASSTRVHTRARAGGIARTLGPYPRARRPSSSSLSPRAQDMAVHHGVPGGGERQNTRVFARPKKATQNHAYRRFASMKKLAIATLSPARSTSETIARGRVFTRPKKTELRASRTPALIPLPTGPAAQQPHYSAAVPVVHPWQSLPEYGQRLASPAVPQAAWQAMWIVWILGEVRRRVTPAGRHRD